MRRPTLPRRNTLRHLALLASEPHAARLAALLRGCAVQRSARRVRAFRAKTRDAAVRTCLRAADRAETARNGGAPSHALRRTRAPTRPGRLAAVHRGAFASSGGGRGGGAPGARVGHAWKHNRVAARPVERPTSATMPRRAAAAAAATAAATAAGENDASGGPELCPGVRHLSAAQPRDELVKNLKVCVRSAARLRWA